MSTAGRIIGPGKLSEFFKFSRLSNFNFALDIPTTMWYNKLGGSQIIRQFRIVRIFWCIQYPVLCIQYTNTCSDHAIKRTYIRPCQIFTGLRELHQELRLAVQELRQGAARELRLFSGHGAAFSRELRAEIWQKISNFKKFFLKIWLLISSCDIILKKD